MKRHSFSIAGTWLLKVALSVLAGLAFIPLTAEASINSVTVNSCGDFQAAHGYTHAEITIHGSVPRADGTVGQYSVPAVIIYPRHRRGNGVGVVDWLNSAFYHFFPPTTEDGTIEFTRRATGNYLFEEGYTYLSIQWNKKVTHIFGPAPIDDGQPHNHLLYGTIERSADAWEILLDAARFLKDPDAYPGKGGPARVATVLQLRYSQGGAAQLELLAEGLDPDRIYDGHLIQMIGLTCWKRNDLDEHFGFFGPCKPLPATGDHAPVIMLASETDMVVYPLLGLGKSAFFVRNQSNPSWRQYRDGWDLPFAGTNLSGQSGRAEHRGRATGLPRRVRQPDRMGARRVPCEASNLQVFRWQRGRDRGLHPDHGCRRPFRGRRPAAARRVDGPRAHRRCATRSSQTAQPSRAG